MSGPDPYRRLRDAPPTPANEYCRCDGLPAIALRSVLGPNPIGCSTCNGKVAPETIGFPLDLAEKIACWNDVSASLELLWLDSREYEAWAKAQLNDPQSPVNRRGLAVSRELSQFRKCYYFLGVHAGRGEKREEPTACSICGDPLGVSTFLGRTCEACGVICEV